MVALFMLGMLLQAQDGLTPQVVELVTRLVANGKEYESALPSLGCEQTVHSQALHKGKVKREVVSTGTLTIKRTEDHQQPFEETYTWKTVNGKDIPDGKRPNNPYFVHGLFTNALGFNDLSILKCKDMKLTEEPGGTELRLDMQLKPEAKDLPLCATRMPGERRTVYVDRATQHVVRLFRTIPEDEAELARDTAYASVEYSPVRLGADQFWLPARAEARKDDGRMLVEYTGCHRFASTVKIIGGTDVVPAPQ